MFKQGHVCKKACVCVVQRFTMVPVALGDVYGIGSWEYHLGLVDMTRLNEIKITQSWKVSIAPRA